MSYKIVQIAGNDAASADAYTGPSREVRVDTDNWNLRIHDGATPGGHTVLNEAENDARYLAATAEAAGIPTFGAGDAGLLCRASAGVYHLRAVVDAGASEIVVTNPSGVAGNIVLGIASHFTTLKTFDAGAHGAFAGSFVGSVDVSTDTFVCAANQIQVSWIDSTALASFVSAHSLWVGAIVWTDTLTGIPSNWHICDGTGGTPDLRDKFIVGSGSTYSIGNTGGSTTQTITINNHTLTLTEVPYHDHDFAQTPHDHGFAQSPHGHSGSTFHDHSHGISTISGGNGRSAGGLGTANLSPGSTSTDGVNSGDFGVDVAAANANITHNADSARITFNGKGGGGGHNHTATGTTNLPPYYALAAYRRMT